MAAAELHARVMASRLHVIVADATPTRSTTEGVDEAMQRAVLYLEHLEQRWSRFIPTSDVSRINRLGPSGGTIEIDPSTLTLLATMIEGHERTAGRYDPTLLREVVAVGYSASRLDPTMISVFGAPAEHRASLHDLELDPAASTVTVPPGLVIDPGGIGKGLAADLAVAQLVGEGVDGALVEIGGDLASTGTSIDPAGWLVDVEHSDPSAGLLCRLAVTGGGVATSSVRSRRWTQDGVERHHQIDPATGACSMTDLVAVTVIAPCGWMAEVHATAALAMGRDQAITYLDGHGLSGIAVAMTPIGDQVWTTRDLADIEFDVRSGVS